MTVILEGIVGSTAYGLATENSDIDRLGVFVGSTQEVLGFGLQEKTITTTKPDGTWHEIGKYVSLAMACNPTILEAMWLPQHEVLTQVGQELIDLRYHFFSADRVKQAYAGYAMQQAKRLLGRQGEGKDGFGDVPSNRTAKHGRHCYRLLIQGEQILRQEHLTVRLAEKEAGQVWLMGEFAVRDPQGFHDAMVQRARALLDLETGLFDKPEVEKIERWLVSVRLREPYGLL
jgi:predicted nucleotidyltransferase